MLRFGIEKHKNKRQSPPCMNTKASVPHVFITILLTFLFVLLLFSVYSAFDLRKFFAQQEPAVIVITKILPQNCPDCFSIEPVEQYIRQSARVTIQNITTLSWQTAKDIITKYTVTKLPAVLITGEISKLQLEPFEQRQDALVFDKTPPPYFDTGEQRIKGKVSAVIIQDSSCKECFKLEPLIQNLRQAGVAITSKVLSYDSSDAKNLIAKYSIKKIPAIILSKDAAEYELIVQAWQQVGSTENDGSFVLRTVNPPYKDLTTNSVKGFVDIIYVVDKSCTTCYNVSLHRNLLTTSFGMHLNSEQFVDVASKEGIKLRTTYQLTKVPTVIVSAEAKTYPNFEDVWKRVGDVARDGSFVFRNLDLLEGMNYKDLQKNTVVTVKNQE